MTTTENSMVSVPKAGEIARTEFGAHQLAVNPETASVALAAQAKAATEARYIMALQRPRDLDASKATLIKECSRPGFAQAAIYHKPIGKGVEGPSIRLAEAAARAFKNILTETPAIYDDAKQRIVRVMATDLENNLVFQKDVTVQKRVERSKGEGRTVISQRQNSYGKVTYLVEATDDEILNTENALISKALRTCLLRLIPGDFIDDAMAACRSTRKKEIEADLPKARTQMMVAYAGIGAMPDQVVAYLGHRIEDATVEELDAMRSLYATIKDGETTWADALDFRKQQREPAPAPATPDDAPSSTESPKTLADLAGKAKAKRTAIVDENGNPIVPGADEPGSGG